MANLVYTLMSFQDMRTEDFNEMIDKISVDNKISFEKHKPIPKELLLFNPFMEIISDEEFVEVNQNENEKKIEMKDKYVFLGYTKISQILDQEFHKKYNCNNAHTWAYNNWGTKSEPVKSIIDSENQTLSLITNNGTPDIFFYDIIKKYDLTVIISSKDESDSIEEIAFYEIESKNGVLYACDLASDLNEDQLNILNNLLDSNNTKEYSDFINKINQPEISYDR